MNKKGSCSLLILKELLQAEKPLSTVELCERTNCERKTVYSAIDEIERSGIGTVVIKREHNMHYYSLVMKGQLCTNN